MGIFSGSNNNSSDNCDEEQFEFDGPSRRLAAPGMLKLADLTKTLAILIFLPQSSSRYQSIIEIDQGLNQPGVTKKDDAPSIGRPACAH